MAKEKCKKFKHDFKNGFKNIKDHFKKEWIDLKGEIEDWILL